MNSDPVKGFLQGLAPALCREMTNAAEPLIKEALKGIEDQLRKRVAEMACAIVESSYVLERDGLDIRITVRLSDQRKPS